VLNSGVCRGKEGREKVCIISFSPLHRDARVLRQVRYLSPHFDLAVIGFGPVPEDWQERKEVQWMPILFSQPKRSTGQKIRYLFQLCGQGRWGELAQRAMMRNLYLGRLIPDLFERWYWNQPLFAHALELATSTHPRVYLANDWNSLPIAVEAASRNSARVLFDAHEYAPLEYDNLWWRMNTRPLILHLLRKYLPQVDAFTTVGPIIARRYQREFKVDPVVIMNASDPIARHRERTDPELIHLVHHGAAFRIRRLEHMIEVIRYCDSRYHLHFLLVTEDTEYLDYLQRLARERTPGRVHFHQPVLPKQVVERISDYDMGIYLLASNAYNDQMALPNKFFDFIAAGLAVCIGPSPEMAAMVRKLGLGCVAPSFRPRDMAHTLNRLSWKDISAMQRASLAAAREINAQHEMTKFLDIIRVLTRDDQPAQDRHFRIVAEGNLL